MQLSLAQSLKGVSYAESNVNPAEAYVAAVVAAGAAVSAGQEAAVDTFFRSAKSGGYYSSLKRLYLPIWGVAAANAIDMITLASGTFNGSVTHGAGFVQGDGSTGYFDTGVKPTTLGITGGGGHIAYININTATDSNLRFIAGCSDATYRVRHTSATASSSGIIGGTVGSSISAARTGVWLTNRSSTTSQITYNRTASGVTTGMEATSANALNVPDYNLYILCHNNSGTAGGFSNGQVGVASFGLNITNVSAYTLALKNLWETATGLTLP